MLVYDIIFFYYFSIYVNVDFYVKFLRIFSSLFPQSARKSIYIMLITCFYVLYKLFYLFILICFNKFILEIVIVNKWIKVNWNWQETFRNGHFICIQNIFNVKNINLYSIVRKHKSNYWKNFFHDALSDLSSTYSLSQYFFLISFPISNQCYGMAKFILFPSKSQNITTFLREMKLRQLELT